MKTNKLLLSAVTAALAMSGTAFAKNMQQKSQSLLKGYDVYVGGGFSRDMLSSDANIVATGNGLFNKESIFKGSLNNSSKQGSNGWSGEIFAGIGKVFNKQYYLAGEIFGSLGNLTQEANFTYLGLTNKLHIYEKTKIKHSYGISIIPGFKLSQNYMIYGRLGFIRTKIKLDAGVTSHISENDSELPAPFNKPLSKQFSQSKNKNGIQLGFGMQGKLSQHISARIEYDWTHFGKVFDENFSKSRSLQNPGAKSTYKLKGHINIKSVQYQQVKLQLAYHFNIA
jgi:opacity protein-like surface antigen